MLFKLAAAPNTVDLPVLLLAFMTLDCLLTQVWLFLLLGWSSRHPRCYRLNFTPCKCDLIWKLGLCR